MKDNYYEQFILRKTTIKDILVCGISVIMTFILVSLGLFFLGNLVVIPAALVIYAVVNYVLSRLKSEYEYDITNQLLDIALIYNKGKRKEMLSINIQNAELIAPEGAQELSCYKPVKTQVFTSGNKAKQRYSMIISINDELREIIIEPDEEMLAIMKKWMGTKMHQM